MNDLSHLVTGCSGEGNDGARCRSAAEIDAVSSVKLVQKRAPSGSPLEAKASGKLRQNRKHIQIKAH